MKKFITTLAFILIVVLFVGCGNNQGNITKDLVNSTINKIDSIITTTNNLGTPNEENINLSRNYQNTTNLNVTEPEYLTFGDSATNYNNAPNPQNMVNRNQNSNINRNDYQNSNTTDKNSINNTNNVNRINNNYYTSSTSNTSNNNYNTSTDSSYNNELVNLSTAASASCRNYIAKKDNLINNCNNCKSELLNILNNNITLSESQLNSLRDYNSKLTELLNNLSNCKNCNTNLSEIQNQNNNGNSVLLSSRYRSYTDNLDYSANFFDTTNNTINELTRLFNPNYQPFVSNNNFVNNQSAQNYRNTNNNYNNNNYTNNNSANSNSTNNNNQKTNNDYSVMPINNDKNNSNSTNPNNAYNNNKRMPDRFRQGIRKATEKISNTNNSANTNLEFKPKNVRA